MDRNLIVYLEINKIKKLIFKNNDKEYLIKFEYTSKREINKFLEQNKK